MLNFLPGQVMWIIIDKCNWGCSYCYNDDGIKSQEDKVDNYKLHIEKIKKTIPKGWNFHLIGTGEPFLHPDFLEIMEGLLQSGYTVSVTTNFSMPIKNLDKFFKIAEKKCLLFRASFHSEYMKIDEYISKLSYIRENFPDFKNLLSVSVALPYNLSFLKILKERVNDLGYKLQVQKLWNKDRNHLQYNNKQIEVIDELNNARVKRKNLPLYTFGKDCHCGYRSVIMNMYGDVFRCHPARQRGLTMGNIFKTKVRLYQKLVPCTEEKCYCMERYKMFF